MTDIDCIDFLQWTLPKLRMRWKGFRKVRKRVCRRLQSRIDELGLESVKDYRKYLEENIEEWGILDSYCRITISRFYRDRELFNTLSWEIFPLLRELALREKYQEVRCWSAGCASGEEPYTLKIIWESIMALKSQRLNIKITATDVNKRVLARAREGLYSTSSFWELPVTLFRRSFHLKDGSYILKNEFKEDITFLKQDIRWDMPSHRFHLILCRNLVFTYFDESLQREILERISAHLLPGGFLITGCHEKISPEDFNLKVWSKNNMIYQKL